MHTRRHYMVTTQARPIDEAALMDIVNRSVGDFGAMLSGTLLAIGDKLGLFRAIADAGSVTSSELARRTGTAERYIREWLASQAASGFITYDGDGRYSLSPEQTEAFTNESSPAYMV